MFKVCDCQILDLGTIDYEACLEQQRALVQDVLEARAPNTIITCQHPPVITYSRLAKKENILATQEQLKTLGVRVCPTDRGGDVTYHGPGQIIFYPILDLRLFEKDLHVYLRSLEQVMINALRDNFGLNAYRKKALTGVWVGPYKVGSIGIAVRHWVTYHGFSLNVKVDRKFFPLVRPCGYDVPVASLSDFLGDFVTVEDIRILLLDQLKNIFNLDFSGGSHG